jgi:hypothetical protein
MYYVYVYILCNANTICYNSEPSYRSSGGVHSIVVAAAVAACAGAAVGGAAVGGGVAYAAAAAIASVGGVTLWGGGGGAVGGAVAGLGAAAAAVGGAQVFGAAGAVVVAASSITAVVAHAHERGGESERWREGEREREREQEVGGTEGGAASADSVTALAYAHHARRARGVQEAYRGMYEACKKRVNAAGSSLTSALQYAHDAY